MLLLDMNVKNMKKKSNNELNNSSTNQNNCNKQIINDRDWIAGDERSAGRGIAVCGHSIAGADGGRTHPPTGASITLGAQPQPGRHGRQERAHAPLPTQSDAGQRRTIHQRRFCYHQR